ncbi:membrane protein insertase YidC [Carnobacterium divergens]|uniref:membrane protein insertase YidC n=1 Tax=Carnobacterium divergens TaxID=2748 RepID=UPI0010718291|nr:membrane protein insertase YidC [Carnobacterium divergens]TFI70912.1 OxaA precursor [Carnobacterium divergens]
MNKLKKLLLTSSVLSLVLFLSGCMKTDKNGNGTGLIYDYLVVPTGNSIIWLADLFNGSYGMAIIFITLIVRIIILPLNLNQAKKSMIQQEKMAVIKPEMDVIQKKQKEAATQEEKAAAQQELMALYKANNMSMTGGIGCLPILIQMPIFTAMYQAIRLSPQIAESNFLGLNLGDKNVYLAIAAGLVYVVQAYLSMIGMPEAQKKQMRMMMFMSPVMILIFTLQSPAGLGLYWLVGGVFACFQTLITNLYHKPKIKAAIAEEMKNRPIQPAVVQKAKPIKAEEISTASKKNTPNPKKGRNSGKQNR